MLDVNMTCSTLVAVNLKVVCAKGSHMSKEGAFIKR